MTDMQDVVNIIIGAVLAVLGWIGRTLWDAVDKLKNDIKQVEVSLPAHYVRRTDLDSRMNKIEAILEKIFDRLNDKADKP